MGHTENTRMEKSMDNTVILMSEMMDLITINGHKRVTLIECSGGNVTVIDDNKATKYLSIKDAVKAIDAVGCVVGTSFLDEPHDKHREGGKHG